MQRIRAPVLFAILLFLIPIAASPLVSLDGRKDKSQLKQNKQADKENLTRIKDDAQLAWFKNNELLVPLPETDALLVNTAHVSQKFRWCRPWTKKFLLSLSKKFHAKFGKKLSVNSAVRTETYQKTLRRRNSNASQSSTHTTGATVDIAKKGLRINELVWLRKELLRLEGAGLIEATEEFSQAVFHIMVFKYYGEKTK